MSRRTPRTGYSTGGDTALPCFPERTHQESSESDESDFEKRVHSSHRSKSRYDAMKAKKRQLYTMSQSSTVSSKFYQNLPPPVIHKPPVDLHTSSKDSTEEISLTRLGYDSKSITNWSGIQQPTKPELLGLLKDMIMSFEKTNVQIRVAETTFNCHMMVLQCYSEFFMNLDCENHIVLPTDKVTPQAFHKVYEWMLSSQPVVMREGILEVFNAAQFLKIRGLVAQCWVCLDDDERFSEDAAFVLYLEARALGQDELIQRLMLNRVSKFFLTLVSTREFVEFDSVEVCRLLSSNSIGVNSETDVLMSAARWLDYKWPEREKHLQEVMQCVRFGLMAPWQLVELKRNIDVKEIQQFFLSPEGQKTMDDALAYVTTKYWYANQEKRDQHYLQRLQLTEPMERQWIVDQMWTDRNEHNNQMCISYVAFCEYLRTIRTLDRDHWRTLQFSETNPNDNMMPEHRVVSRMGNVMPEGDIDEGEVGRLENESL